MSTESYLHGDSESTRMNRSAHRVAARGGDGFRVTLPVEKTRTISDSSVFLMGRHLSPWSRSRAKRLFDCACVLAIMPLLIPVFLLTGLAVRLTSFGPVLFLQKRLGRHGRTFTILKFRTMVHSTDGAHKPVTTSGNQQFTPVGPFLRRWKLDEVPQLFNVLAGHMSLVGPRPKLPQHAIANLGCRAGITGGATIAFAREEEILERVPRQHLDSFFHSVVLPAKHKLDADYMAQATFRSDLKLIVDSVLRRWDSTFIEGLLQKWAEQQGEGIHLVSKAESDNPQPHAPMIPHIDRPASTGEVQAF